MPLSESDYQTMNCPYREFLDVVGRLPEKTQSCVVNATHRLAEVEWLTRKQEEDVRLGNSSIVHEGLLSLQIYLLLSCADNLGHVLTKSTKVGDRFKAFFRHLPDAEKQELTSRILAWKTDFAELVRTGLGDPNTNTAVYPTRQQILDAMQPLTLEERLETVIDILYMRRNRFTHESDYPQLGHHPNLLVMQLNRMKVPKTGTMKDLDRLQVLYDESHIYYAFYETDDLIATIRWIILRGMGRLMGRV